jgi:predicted RNA methylase
LIKKNPDIINGGAPAKTAIFEILARIQSIEENSVLYEEKSFDRRIEVIDCIEYEIIDQIEELLRKATQPTQLILLKNRAEKVKSELEGIDTRLFQKLRKNIRKERYRGKGFEDLVKEYVNFDYNTDQEEPDYDNLDLFINGLSSFKTMPEQSKELEPEMVYYQKTPARIVFELVEKCHPVKEDVFFDLGSGLGQVAILVNLLTGITTKGIEFEPAFCNYARICAAELNLSNVTFTNADARKADYSDGTIFFMFTPFKGEIMQAVLAVLRKEAMQRRIKIITYGPGTVQVALQNWLASVTPMDDNMYKLAIFNSL